MYEYTNLLFNMLIYGEFSPNYGKFPSCHDLPPYFTIFYHDNSEDFTIDILVAIGSWMKQATREFR